MYSAQNNNPNGKQQAQVQPKQRLPTGGKIREGISTDSGYGGPSEVSGFVSHPYQNIPSGPPPNVHASSGKSSQYHPSAYTRVSQQQQQYRPSEVTGNSSGTISHHQSHPLARHHGGEIMVVKIPGI